MKIKIIKGALVRPFGRVSVGDELELDQFACEELICNGVAEEVKAAPKKKKATRKSK